jgi:hypothetical protein
MVWNGSFSAVSSARRGEVPLERRGKSMEKISTIGLDLAKSLYQVHGIASEGQVVIRKQLRRGELLRFFGRLSPCFVGMEACGGAHYWAREIAALGHEVRLIPPAGGKERLGCKREADPVCSSA